MTGDLEQLREIFGELLEDHQEELWENTDWQPPLEERDGEKVVDEDYYSEMSDREWAMFIAGKMDAFGAAKAIVESAQSDSGE
jgi:hypothetical protein